MDVVLLYSQPNMRFSVNNSSVMHCVMQDSYRVVVAMQALLAILAFIEAVLAIWGASICCQAVCCCTPQPQTVSMQIATSLRSHPQQTSH